MCKCGEQDGLESLLPEPSQYPRLVNLEEKWAEKVVSKRRLSREKDRKVGGTLGS